MTKGTPGASRAAQKNLALQVPNGELSAKQLRWLGDAIAKLDGGCGDITTRANIQLRGMTLAEADKIFEVLCVLCTGGVA